MRVNTVEFETPALRIRRVRCRAPRHDRAPVEYAAASTLVLPQSGMFVKHVSRHAELLTDPLHGVFFTAGAPYSVSHPTPWGDDCLVIEYRPHVLGPVLYAIDPSGPESDPPPLPALGVWLDPRMVLRRRLLCHWVSRGSADALAVEEEAFTLFAAALRAAREPIRPLPVPRRSRRQLDQVRAAQLAIGAEPARRWSLDALGRLVDCSPFHLVRLFRSVVGVPIHRYLLHARLTLALDAILDSGYSLSRIALETGFAHHSHFTEAFRRAFGVTPSAVRRTARGPRGAGAQDFDSLDGLRGVGWAPHVGATTPAPGAARPDNGGPHAKLHPGRADPGRGRGDLWRDHRIGPFR